MTMKYNNIHLNTNTTFQIQNLLYSWFCNINPQYFLTIQLPKHLRSRDLTKSNQKLFKIMSKFEKILLGRHWNRKYMPFITIAEHGKKSLNWHYHVLIYDCNFNFLQVQQAFQSVSDQLYLPYEVLYIEPVNDNGVNDYVSKEFDSDVNYHIDSDRIITSEILFNLPYKPITRMPESQKQSQNHEN